MNTADAAGVNERLLEIIRTQGDVAKLGPDLGAVMALVAERARTLTHAMGAVVELAEGSEMVYRAAAGAVESHLGLRLSRAHSLSGLCVQQGHALCCEDSETDQRVDRVACRRVGLRSMVVVPLRHHDTVIGVLKVMSERVAAFAADDLRVLGLMSDLIAAAMFHATQHAAGELFHRATHDVLTGLANRALFYDRLRHCLDQARRESRHLGVLYLDMDGLKPINDRYGHRAGDAAICEFGTRIRDAARKSDTVARLGGDEFAVILAKVDDHAGALAHVHRLEQRIGVPFEFEHKPIALGASIGIALYPRDGNELESLLEAADRAMYAIKRARASPA
jgi:diguanylate cyclase (GGDEF)-like protein